MMAKKTKADTAAAGKRAPADATTAPGTPRMLDFYLNTVRPQLATSLSRTNPHAIPKLVKIVVNMGVGVAVTEKKYLEEALGALAQITGQKVVVTRAKKAIAGFKIRQGMPIGVAVTLRGERMYAFLERLIHLALPRIRDFRGVSPKSFDGRGNYTLGIREQIILPEISFDQIDAIRGMDVTIVTSARNDDEGRALLREMGMPFRSN